SFVTGVRQAQPGWNLQGRWFARPDECVVGSKFAKRNRIKVGDDVNVSASNDHAALKVTGIVITDGPESDSIIAPLELAQKFANKPGQYQKLYVSAFTKPDDAFARRDPKSMKPDELERWSCSPYASSIAYTIRQALPGSDVRIVRRVAEG